VKSRTSERFRLALARLPAGVQRRARLAYRRFARDPAHPSLRFKAVHATRPIYAVRIGLGHRALGVRAGDEIVWFWIGSHAEYDQLLKELGR
jgi:hypothetical protein